MTASQLLFAWRVDCARPHGKESVYIKGTFHTSWHLLYFHSFYKLKNVRILGFKLLKNYHDEGHIL